VKDLGSLVLLVASFGRLDLKGWPPVRWVRSSPPDRETDVPLTLGSVAAIEGSGSMFSLSTGSAVVAWWELSPSGDDPRETVCDAPFGGGSADPTSTPTENIAPNNIMFLQKRIKCGVGERLIGVESGGVGDGSAFPREAKCSKMASMSR
jgi:hypothetical protein